MYFENVCIVKDSINWNPNSQLSIQTTLTGAQVMIS